MRFILTTLLLALVAIPSLGRSLVVTHQASFEGDVEETEFEFLLNKEEQTVQLQRIALDRLLVKDSGESKAILKDGRVVDGQLKGSVTISDGSIKRNIPAEDIVSVAFDIFVKLENDFVVTCPIRAEFTKGIDQFFRGKEKRFMTTKPRLAKCDKSYLNMVTLARRGSRSVVKSDGERLKEKVVAIKPEVFIAHGTDQYVTTHFFLMQGENQLASGARSFSGDEGEINRPSGFAVLAYSPDEIDPEGPPLSLRYQMISVDEKEDRGKETHYWWFVIQF